MRQPLPHTCPRSDGGFKLTAVLTVGDEVAISPKAVLQTVSAFAFGGVFLLLFLILFLFILVLIITPHILDVLGKERTGFE